MHVTEIIERYDALLIDAYGVLVDGADALPGARRFVERLHARAIPFFILTNDASKLPETSSARYARCGLEIPAERVITSGSLLTRWFSQHKLQGAETLVLGPADSASYVRLAGGRPVTIEETREPEVVVVADEAGYDFLETLDETLSLLYRLCDAGRPPRLVLPNPDLVYPKRPGAFGFGAGTIANALHAALQLRYDAPDLAFEPLGKPYPPIFEAAVERAGTRNLLMIGDQLATDIAGAQRFGIDSALVRSGVTRAVFDGGPQPTWILESVDPEP